MTTTMPAIAPLRHGTVLAWVSFLGLVVGTVLIGTAYFLNAFTGDVADDGLAPIGAALYLVASVLWLTPSLVDRKSTRLNSSHTDISRMPSSA